MAIPCLESSFTENVGVDWTLKTRTISTDLPETVGRELERKEPIMCTEYELKFQFFFLIEGLNI